MPRARVQGLGLLAAVVLAAASPASAATTTTIVPTGSGLSLPAGVVRDNAGAIWVSDALLGVCKVDPALPGGSATVRSDFCAPEPAAAPAPPEVDGAPPAPGVEPERPTATFQLAFDAATNNLFVAEGGSSASGVWKLAVDPATSTIASAAKIVAEADRVFGVALGTAADGAPVLDYTTKRSPLIHRVLNPATCAPCAPLAAGSALDKGGLALANLNGVLYVAEELAGVTRLSTPGPAGGVATPVVGFPGGAPTALAADSARGRVYAGTTNGNNQDQVDVLDPATGAVETYALGLTGVTALFAAPDGELLIGDDPAHGAETAGNGRLESAAFTPMGVPHAAITDGPAHFTNAGAGTFWFSGPAGASFECRLDGGAWTPCGSAPSGTFETGAVTEGVHAFEVRAVSADPAIGAGPVQVHTFVADHTAPGVTVDNAAADHELIGATALTMRFSASDPTVAFACSLDGAAPTPCSDPRRLTGLGLGDHVFAVTATDAAGNASAPATFAITVRPAPARPQGQAPTVAGPAGPEHVPAARGAARLAAELRPGRVSLVRLRSSLAHLRTTRRVVFRLTAPAIARTAVVALWRTNASRPRAGRAPVAFATLTLPRAGGQQVALTLTRRQAARLRAGRYLAGLVLTDGSSRYGPTRFRRLTIRT